MDKMAVGKLRKREPLAWVVPFILILVGMDVLGSSALRTEGKERKVALDRPVVAIGDISPPKITNFTLRTMVPLLRSCFPSVNNEAS